jgi:glycosyltransferase involved in cell wall biosynthesis
VEELTPINSQAPDVPTLLLSVIIPARDEQDVLPACLKSLIDQSEPGFELGRDWEIIVINDRSSDSTGDIASEAAQLDGVSLIEAPTFDSGPHAGFTGKTNACWAGAQAAQGALLLFTDADTLHEPGSLSRARHELQKYEVAMLSYSPLQLTSGLLQRMIMPLVFAELAIAYPMKRVNEPEDRTAAANGQFLLVREDDYFALGGHRAVGRNVLEDVALADNFKRSKRAIRFRYAPDALSTRMYRTTAAMVEGWTKNLALLFTAPIPLALLRLLDFLLIVFIPVIALEYYFPTNLPRVLLWVVWARVLWRFYARVAKSNFPLIDCVVSVFGIPVLLWLLIRSYVQVRVVKKVEWKGRSYSTTLR